MARIRAAGLATPGSEPVARRRHHNTKGYRQIRQGRTRDQVREIAKRIGVPYAREDRPPEDREPAKSPEANGPDLA